jgi:hypothetical protein
MWVTARWRWGPELGWLPRLLAVSRMAPNAAPDSSVIRGVLIFILRSYAA